MPAIGENIVNDISLVGLNLKTILHMLIKVNRRMQDIGLRNHKDIMVYLVIIYTKKLSYVSR